MTDERNVYDAAERDATEAVEAMSDEEQALFEELEREAGGGEL